MARKERVARRLPTGEPCCAKAPYSSFLRGGAYSVAMRTAPPHSPPMATPWTIRNKMSSTGAAAPICAYPGSSPTQKVAAPIMVRVVTSAFLRP